MLMLERTERQRYACPSVSKANARPNADPSPQCTFFGGDRHPLRRTRVVRELQPGRCPPRLQQTWRTWPGPRVRWIQRWQPHERFGVTTLFNACECEVGACFVKSVTPTKGETHAPDSCVLCVRSGDCDAAWYGFGRSCIRSAFRCGCDLTRRADRLSSLLDQRRQAALSLGTQHRCPQGRQRDTRLWCEFEPRITASARQSGIEPWNATAELGTEGGSP